MEKKYFVPLYSKHIHFLLKRCNWLVTRIYSYYTFEQSKFKKDFVVMNQVSRQNAKNKVEKDFYKLLNNANFGYDCRNNADNCFFAPEFDKTVELSYVKKYQNVFNPEITDFVLTELLESQIKESYNKKLMHLNQNEEFYDA